MDFRKIRVHADPAAAATARVLGANAYTVGAHIVFAPGWYRPGQAAGLRLLGHELAHVMQQDGTGGPPGPAQEVEADAAAEAVEAGTRPEVRAHSLVGLAAQPDPARFRPFRRLDPAEIEPYQLTDTTLGLRIVDPAEIEITIRRILVAPGGGIFAQCRNDFKSKPAVAKANLEHSHWRNDNERLLYARCYFEHVLGSTGEGVDRDALFQTLVNYEVQVQSQSADLVVQNPRTADDKVKLAQLRKQRRAEGRQRAEFEGPLDKAGVRRLPTGFILACAPVAHT